MRKKTTERLSEFIKAVSPYCFGLVVKLVEEKIITKKTAFYLFGMIVRKYRERGI